MTRDAASMAALIESIKTEGIREPVLLGDDGRVWDGHHRICAAMHIGIDRIPVKSAGEERLTESRWRFAGAAV